MAIRKIVKYGNPILRKKLKEVDFKAIEAELPALLKDMEATCLSVGGVGLAANQIGLDHRLALILMPEGNAEDKPRKYKRFVIINPVIDSAEGEILDEEGCLSLPGLWAEIKRAKEVTVRYTNEHGAPMSVKAKGLLAKALQHEIDHLDGKIFTDYADDAIKPQIEKELKRIEKLK